MSRSSSRGARIAALIGAGALVVLVAGGVSVSRWMRAPAPAPPPSAREPAPASAPDVPIAPPPPGTALPGALPTLPREGAAPENPLDPEERERRRALALRLRALIEEGPREAPAGDFGGLLGAAEPVPLYRDGELLGIELRQVAPEGFYARMGLREGDLVQSINDVPFDSPDLARELVWSLTTGASVELEVERSDGSQERVSLPREQVLGELEALGSGE